MKVYFIYNNGIDNYSPLTKRLLLYVKMIVPDFQVSIITRPSKNSELNKEFNDLLCYPKISEFTKLKVINRLFKPAISVLNSYSRVKYINDNVRENSFLFFIDYSLKDLFILRLFLNDKYKIVLELNENPYSPEAGFFDFVFLRKFKRFILVNLFINNRFGFITISKALTKLVLNQNVSYSKLLQIPAICEQVIFFESDVIYRNKISKPFILHTGSLSETKDGVFKMFESFGKAYEKLNGALSFVVVGNSGNRKTQKLIQSLLFTYKCEKDVFFLNNLNNNEMENLRRNAMCAIINKPNNWQNEFNFPTKIPELMLSGVPLISTNTGELKYFLDGKINSFIVEENNSIEISERIIELFKDESIGQKFSLELKSFAENNFIYSKFKIPIINYFKILNEK